MTDFSYTCCLDALIFGFYLNPKTNKCQYCGTFNGKGKVKVSTKVSLFLADAREKVALWEVYNCDKLFKTKDG